MRPEAPLRLLRESDQDRLDADVDRCIVVAHITGGMEVVLVYDRPPAKPLWPKNQVERLAHRGLADVVAADQQRVTGKGHASLANAAKIADVEQPDLHSVPATLWCPGWAERID